jgi:hypothetical protein
VNRPRNVCFMTTASNVRASILGCGVAALHARTHTRTHTHTSHPTNPRHRPQHYAWTELEREKGGLGKVNIPLVSDLTREISKAYVHHCVHSIRLSPRVLLEGALDLYGE